MILFPRIDVLWQLDFDDDLQTILYLVPHILLLLKLHFFLVTTNIWEQTQVMRVRVEVNFLRLGPRKVGLLPTIVVHELGLIIAYTMFLFLLGVWYYSVSCLVDFPCLPRYHPLGLRCPMWATRAVLQFTPWRLSSNSRWCKISSNVLIPLCTKDSFKASQEWCMYSSKYCWSSLRLLQASQSRIMTNITLGLGHSALDPLDRFQMLVVIAETDVPP